MVRLTSRLIPKSQIYHQPNIIMATFKEMVLWIWVRNPVCVVLRRSDKMEMQYSTITESNHKKS